MEQTNVNLLTFWTGLCIGLILYAGLGRILGQGGSITATVGTNSEGVTNLNVTTEIAPPASPALPESECSTIVTTPNSREVTVIHGFPEDVGAAFKKMFPK